MADKLPQKRSFAEYCQITFAGFAMGVANVIPGVSGGTMAFILGVFEELVDAIGEFASMKTFRLLFRFQFKELYRTLPWRFLLALGIGILIAFAGVSKLFIYLLDTHQSMTYAFFFGLILASIITVAKKVHRWNGLSFLFGALGAIVAYIVITLVPMETPNTWLFTFLCGIIVICAMILPGLSGSFLLLILGQYSYVWGAIGDFSSGHFSLAGFSTLFWLGLGCLIGIGSFVHLLKYLFEKFHDPTVAALIGFMVGSIPRLWPWQDATQFAIKTAGGLLKVGADSPELAAARGAADSKITVLVVENRLPVDFGGSFWAIVGLLAAGLALVLVLEFWATRKEAKSAPAPAGE